ncbi:MAG: PaaX family transcrtiptional regulator [Chloroflexi bacterium]|nr:PaaX family transcrtiptional regulator [Chloroflexota bacterium]
MMFTLFGDYIRQRGGEIWVSSLIQIAGQFGLSQQAVRSALSRMSQNGWLRVRRVENRSYYGPTPRTRRVLEEGERRIFSSRTEPWDHRWRLVMYSIPERRREVRTELRKQLSWLGYGPLSSGTWICPHDVDDDVRGLVAGLGIGEFVETFTAAHTGTAAPRELAARCWDLEGINRRYEAFVAKYEPRFDAFTRRGVIPDNECFVERFLLIHEYRKFFFMDPELPRELLPDEWHGTLARGLFQRFHGLLAVGANQYFDSVFEGPPKRRKMGKPDQPRLAAALVV